MTFSPFDPDRLAIRRRRFRAIPVRMLMPNLITLLALCAGLTAIRLAFEDRLEWALAAIVFAAALDGLDGRVARLIKGQSRFGAELDSLADFVNFGCAPGLIVYLWGLHDLGNVGWIAAMVFAICGALRLARFNVMIDDPNRPLWAGNFFTGVPAPAGAIVVMLPIYINLLGGPKVAATITLLYTLAIAFLMVSQLPVFSGKRVGKRVPPEMVLPVFVLVVLFFALLIAYPWWVLSIGTVCYLACLPLGWVSYKEYQRKDAMSAAQATACADVPAPDALPPRPAEDPSVPPGSTEPRPPRHLIGSNMPRATRVLHAAERRDTPVVDTLILPHAQRQAQKGFLFGVKGTCVELDFAEPVRLRTDDALVLDDGGLVEIVAEPEPLIEARAADLPALARLAWHLGDRHVPVQVLERRLRLKRDPAIEALLQSLGAKVVAIEAPFEPEGGAYAAPADDHHHHDHQDHDHRSRPRSWHDHDHDHGHDHHHHDHDHTHDHKRG